VDSKIFNLARGRLGGCSRSVGKDHGKMKEQLLNLLYKNQREIYAEPDGRDEFECLVGLIEDGTIGSFKELAEYGVE
jgi:hypothetical protein